MDGNDGTDDEEKVDDRDDEDVRRFARLDLTGIRSQSVMAIKSTRREKVSQRWSMDASAYIPIRTEGNRRQVALCEGVDTAKTLLLLQGRGNRGGV